MKEHYTGGVRVFEGARGGYLKNWPNRFPGWASVAEVDRLSSHIMRHSYAVALLSGTWGYEPASMEFVSKQLGHADVQTTERYYAAFEAGTWQREARRLTGQEARPSTTDAVTATGLLSPNTESSIESSIPHFPTEKPPDFSQIPSLTPSTEKSL